PPSRLSSFCFSPSTQRHPLSTLFPYTTLFRSPNDYQPLQHSGSSGEEAAMQSTGQTVPVSKTTLWAGRILGTLAVVFLLFDAVLHLLKPAPVAAAFAQLGYPLDLAVGIGILELVCVAI